MPKSIPTLGDSNWGVTLNNHLSQLQSSTTGGINTFEQFSQRPTNLTADDVGKTYLYTQTGNLHQWTGTTWKVLNESIINVKDYGAVGDGLGKTPTELGMDITNAIWNAWPQFIIIGVSGAINEHNYTAAQLAQKPFDNDDSWDYIGLQVGCWYAGQNNFSKVSNRTKIYIPSGKYNLTRTLYISAGMQMNIKGSGILSTVLKAKDVNTFKVNGVAKCLLCVYSYYGYSGGVGRKISDFCIEGLIQYPKYLDTNNITADWSFGIVAFNIFSTIFRDLWITGCDIGVWFDFQSNDNFMDGCTFEFCGTSIYLNTSSLVITNTEIYSSWAIAQNPGSNSIVANGIVVKNSGDVRISSCVFAEYKGSAIIADNNVTVNNCYFYSKVGLQILNTNGNMNITSNTFQITAGNGLVYGIIQVGGNNTIINSNIFRVKGSLQRPSNEGAITISPSADGTSPKFISITNNSFQIDALDMAISDNNFFPNSGIKCMVANNTFSNSAANKVYLRADPSNIIINNIFGL